MQLCNQHLSRLWHIPPDAERAAGNFSKELGFSPPTGLTSNSLRSSPCTLFQGLFQGQMPSGNGSSYTPRAVCHQWELQPVDKGYSLSGGLFWKESPTTVRGHIVPTDEIFIIRLWLVFPPLLCHSLRSVILGITSLKNSLQQSSLLRLFLVTLSWDKWTLISLFFLIQ